MKSWEHNYISNITHNKIRMWTSFLDNEECQLLVSLNLLCIFEPEKCIKLPKKHWNTQIQVKIK